jgi:hypothetical protein
MLPTLSLSASLGAPAMPRDYRAHRPTTYAEENAIGDRWSALAAGPPGGEAEESGWVRSPGAQPNAWSR